ncbi:MAG TPA: hypothetical protein VG893_06845 [Terracidiphilus sp.]|nr:hypothetical protein [Terracidiphilus sp.]
MRAERDGARFLLIACKPFCCAQAKVGEVTIICSRCGSSDFQASRVRFFADLKHLLRLQLPVRCRNCKHRRFAPRSFAHALPPAPHRGKSS